MQKYLHSTVTNAYEPAIALVFDGHKIKECMATAPADIHSQHLVGIDRGETVTLYECIAFKYNTQKYNNAHVSSPKNAWQQVAIRCDQYPITQLCHRWLQPLRLIAEV